jgi:hypothetical protein
MQFMSTETLHQSRNNSLEAFRKSKTHQVDQPKCPQPAVAFRASFLKTDLAIEKTEANGQLDDRL